MLGLEPGSKVTKHANSSLKRAKYSNGISAFNSSKQIQMVVIYQSIIFQAISSRKRHYFGVSETKGNRSRVVTNQNGERSGKNRRKYAEISRRSF